MNIYDVMLSELNPDAQIYDEGSDYALVVGVYDVFQCIYIVSNWRRP